MALADKKYDYFRVMFPFYPPRKHQTIRGFVKRLCYIFREMNTGLKGVQFNSKDMGTIMPTMKTKKANTKDNGKK